MDTTTEALLAPRTPRPGCSAYVYSAADMDEIVAAVWAPAADKLAAAETIKAACYASSAARTSQAKCLVDESIRDAIRRRSSTPAPVRTQAAAPAPRARHSTGGSWCKRCQGPVADGSGFCGEC